VEVISEKEELQLDLIDLTNLFAPNEDFSLIHKEEIGQGKIINKFDIKCPSLNLEKMFEFESDFDNNFSELKSKSVRKRIVKNNLYKILSEVLNKTLPWGSLTGIRPTKFARDMIESGELKESLVAEVLERDYYVSRNKAKLVANILKNQKCIIKNDNLIDLYINIPICPSRCLYCSFISNEIGRVRDKVERYIDCLIQELNAVKKIIAQNAYIVRNIYIGGGTPSVLNGKQLDRLLSEISFSCSEFTCECGRPDTIDEDKLQVMKIHGVTRISINPQTFCDATLKRIGRKHSSRDVLSAYSLALEKGFVVNMDLIAGLPGERFSTFKKTIKTVLDLCPENITVHTLSIKNGGLLKFDTSGIYDDEVVKMIDFAEKTLMEKGYKPYYMYRQKHQLKGLENVGFYRDENVCVFNIDSMEETNTVIAVGAGAMTKRVFNVQHRIERLPNPKFIEDYIDRVEEIIEKKKEFFK